MIFHLVLPKHLVNTTSVENGFKIVLPYTSSNEVEHTLKCYYISWNIKDFFQIFVIAQIFKILAFLIWPSFMNFSYKSRSFLVRNDYDIWNACFTMSYLSLPFFNLITWFDWHNFDLLTETSQISLSYKSKFRLLRKVQTYLFCDLSPLPIIVNNILKVMNVRPRLVLGKYNIVVDSDE